jgi:hypothetical protein
VDHFDARSETTQEQAAFALAADPRAYGDPDEGWRPSSPPRRSKPDRLPAPRRICTSSPCATATRAPSPPQHGPAGLTIRTEAFTALIGSPAGDARGEPALELRRR